MGFSHRKPHPLVRAARVDAAILDSSVQSALRNEQ